jgi:uncharacterized protein (DUF924 family)
MDIIHICISSCYGCYEHGDGRAISCSVEVLNRMLALKQAGQREVEKLLLECMRLEDAEELQSCVEMELEAAESHCDVIRKWGRFPHRNKILGRPNTAAEEEAFKTGAIPSF